MMARGFMSVSGRLFLTLDTGFVCVPHGYIGNIPCYWYSLGHLWTSYIQWCSDFSNRKFCAQYAEIVSHDMYVPVCLCVCVI